MITAEIPSEILPFPFAYQHIHANNGETAVKPAQIKVLSDTL